MDFTEQANLLYLELLNHAEARYGYRDPSFQITGIEIISKGKPSIFFVDDKRILIHLGRDCQYDMCFTTFHLAHEIIHCLSPPKINEVNFLEEGLAVYFSLEMVKLYMCNIIVGDKKYEHALSLICPILNRNYNFIKDLREVEPSLHKVTEEMIMSVDKNISAKRANLLVTKFMSMISKPKHAIKFYDRHCPSANYPNTPFSNNSSFWYSLL